MRYAAIVLPLIFGSAAPAIAQVSVNIEVPGAELGINVPDYPELVPVPGYPVYYARGGSTNLFFYDGMYWAFQGDSWYASSWYNGPWEAVDPVGVPLFVLRVPVSYYPRAPAFFLGWQANSAPRWGDHWGSGWQEQHRGWETWNRNAVPAAAPLPVYQRQYSGSRYPQPTEQITLQTSHYRYQPHDVAVREQAQRQVRAAPVQSAEHPAVPATLRPAAPTAMRPAAAPQAEAKLGAPRPGVTPHPVETTAKTVAPAERAASEPHKPAAPAAALHEPSRVETGRVTPQPVPARTAAVREPAEPAPARAAPAREEHAAPAKEEKAPAREVPKEEEHGK